MLPRIRKRFEIGRRAAAILSGLGFPPNMLGLGIKLSRHDVRLVLGTEPNFGTNKASIERKSSSTGCRVPIRESSRAKPY